MTRWCHALGVTVVLAALASTLQAQGISKDDNFSGELPPASERKSGQMMLQDEPIVPFQVAEPVLHPEPPRDEHGCVHTQLLMQHVFGFSYGHPFVGMLDPLALSFDQY